jgi:hypothetical protein
LKIVIGPMIWLLVLVVRTLLGTVQGEQPGPVTTMSALVGSKLLPLIVREKEFVLAGTEFGEMLLVVTVPEVTVNVCPFETGPFTPF